MAFIGIDLGTTNSAVAIHRRGRAEILRDRQGKEIIPSVAGIDNKTREMRVGESARALLPVDPQHAVEEIKRKMGTSERVRLGPQEYLPQEIAALILRHLKEAAEDQLGEPVERAVITVPANFPDPARQATKAAGELAGLRVERIINEPTAAALAFGQDEDVEEELVLVYDLGGGTFDVSVVEIVGTALDVRASAGDPHLGGGDLDRALLAHVAERFTAQEGIELDLDPGQGTYYRLLHACEQAKKELSFNVATTVHIPFFTIKDGQPVSLDVEVTRAQFERLVGPMIDRTERSVDRALKDAGLARSDIQRVLLIGGSTRIPYVRALVERVTGRKPQTDVDPDRAVALGAAVQAAIVEGEVEQIIMDVCPLSLGTSTLIDVGGVMMSGYYSEIIEPNTPVLKPISKPFQTVVENQRIVDFQVYQRSVESNEEWAEVDGDPNVSGGFTFLGNKEIDVPPGPAGQEVRATYTYNLNGIVEVEIAFDRASEPAARFEVTTLQSAEEMAESRERLDRLWEESEHYGKVRATLHAAERKLEENLERSARKELEALVAALQEALAKNDGEDVERLERLLTDLLFDLQD